MIKRLILIAVMCAFVAAPALADLTPIGDFVEGASWTQAFDEGNPSIGPFDLVAVKMTSLGDTFETQTHFNFSNAGWALAYENTPPSPTLASASGTSVNYLAWSIKFAGASSNPLVFDYVAFNGNTIANTAHAVWGPGWSITNYGTKPSPYWNPTRAEVVPVPAAVLLGMLGFCVAGLKLRKLA